MKKAIGALALTAVAMNTMAAEFTKAEICKAAIAIEMGRDVKTMKATASGGNPEISYRRSDGDTFRYQCQVSNGTVVWRGFMNDTQDWGRWRSSYAEGDSRLTYSVSGSKLTVESTQSEPETFTKKSF
ncbi:hypothetical protein [Pseudomonas sp. Leaf127]|uniref:hypothetical protein n=1 Tax=Pseudomonas sp. Leaf127 TaxID=1736267 RepID=UPI001F26A146|nr:hypothetical protein [Pseudomonas sp. Leaf127]